MKQILRGEVWLVDLSPVRGREQAGKRPCLVVSVDLFNQGGAELAIAQARTQGFALPITSKNKGIPFHVEVNPPEAGLRMQSFIKCEDVRSISVERFERKLGAVAPETLAQVEIRLKILMSL